MIVIQVGVDNLGLSKFTNADGSRVSLRWRLSRNTGIYKWSKHFICKATAFVSFLVYSYLLFLFSLSKHLHLNPANLSLPSGLESEKGSWWCIWPRRGVNFFPFFREVTQQRCKENWAFHCLVHTPSLSLFSPSFAHRHQTHTHTPIIKGERSSPPSLFASSKSP